MSLLDIMRDLAEDHDSDKIAIYLNPEDFQLLVDHIRPGGPIRVFWGQIELFPAKHIKSNKPDIAPSTKLMDEVFR